MLRGPGIPLPSPGVISHHVRGNREGLKGPLHLDHIRGCLGGYSSPGVFLGGISKADDCKWKLQQEKGEP